MEKIPKILHMYWDKKPMSWLQSLTPISFNKYNPDWTINIYVPRVPYSGKTSYIPAYKGKDYFNTIKEKLPNANIIEVSLKNYGIDPNLHDILRSDILRYHLLYEQGGVWSDFDVLWLKPMSHFHNIEYHGDVEPKDITAVVSLINNTYGGHSIGILIHTKNDEYAKDLINLTTKVRPPYKHESFGSVMISSKYPTLESLSGFKGLIGVKEETYYPYRIHPPKVTFDKLYTGNDLSLITNNTICLHWYNGKDLSKQYVNGDGTKRACTMTTILRNEGYLK